MRQEINVQDNQIIAILSGSMYIEETAVLKDRLIKYIEQGFKNVVIDMRDVDYIDSSGLDMLEVIQNQALQQAGSVTICNLHGIVKELFELTKLTEVLRVSAIQAADSFYVSPPDHRLTQV